MASRGSLSQRAAPAAAPGAAPDLVDREYVDGKPGGAGLPAPEVNDLVAWSTDPINVTSSLGAAAGVIYLARVVVPSPVTATGVACILNTAGVANSVGYLGLYSAAGARLAVSANQTTAWQSTGDKLVPFTAPVALQPGDYWIAYLVNGTTTPKPSAAVTNSRLNWATAAGRFRSANILTGQTALPANLTMPDMSARTDLLLVGLY